MNLLYDLAQTLLIPLARWDLRAFGLEMAVPVSPLLLIVGLLLAERVLRIGARHVRASAALVEGEESAWDESPAPLTVPEAQPASA